MKLARTKAELRDLLGGLSHPVGLVPTMGNLHEGHLNLVRWSKQHTASTITTIFVNPLQFAPSEDFGSYPRMLMKDAEKLEALRVDVLFAPSDEEMYPEGKESHVTVSVPDITRTLCGSSRPTHFDGVTTVVSKLFHLCQPNIAYFGEKDWQQLTVIKRMAEQLDFPLHVEGVPTTRHDDGLAMSSRNQYLTADERAIAPTLFRTLTSIANAREQPGVDVRALEGQGMETLAEAGFKPDYVCIRDQDTLQETQTYSSNLRVFGAAHLGKARLIDNVAVSYGK